MRELGELREQKKVLQHQIADLFSLMAKHGEENVSLGLEQKLTAARSAGHVPA